jgi:hypothetical protein
MSAEPDSLHTLQLSLLNFEKPSTNQFELFPKIWATAEGLLDPDVGNRQRSLAILEEMKAARYSPLVSHLLFSKISEPDLGLRSRIIKNLAEILSVDVEEGYAPDLVRQVLVYDLCQMRPGEIYLIIEAVDFDQSTENAASSLLGTNCVFGEYLAEIMIDRKTKLSIRKQAIHLIGRVGYIDVTPAIERMINRLEPRLNGQQSFSSLSPDTTDEVYLLPHLKSTLTILKAP